MNEKILNWTTALVSVAIIVTLIKCMIVGGAVEVPDPPIKHNGLQRSGGSNGCIRERSR